MPQFFINSAGSRNPKGSLLVDLTRITLKKGLDLPIAGKPDQDAIHAAPAVSTVGWVGSDFIGLKPTLLVEEGHKVKLGQALFEDKANPGVRHTAPAAGTVVAINRGARRVLQSVVIRVDGSEAVTFPRHAPQALATLDNQAVRQQLLDSGLWTALRARPYSKIARPDTTPAAIFVTAIDTHPLAPAPARVIREYAEDFRNGLTVLTRLGAPEVFVCRAPGDDAPLPELPALRAAEFSGPHPAGLVGTHIHFLKPVGASRFVWHIGYQDVIAIGKLFTSGQLWTERVVALAGPLVKQPRLLRVPLAANIEELIAGQIEDTEARALSGSVLSGRTARGWAAFLSPYHNQVTVLAEGRHRELFGWVRPGIDRFSNANVFFSALSRARRMFNFSTTTNGSPRAMVPIGNYESVMPLDILPTQLLRYLLVRDTDTAQALGALELDEEDLALCSYVCVGKYEYGPVLRANLEQIETEG